jgi:hypothetical protein
MYEDLGGLWRVSSGFEIGNAVVVLSDPGTVKTFSCPWIKKCSYLYYYRSTTTFEVESGRYRRRYVVTPGVRSEHIIEKML